MAESGDNGTNSGASLSTRARAWFERLSRVKKVLATSAALAITVGGVASATTSVLDLGTRLSANRSETPQVSPVKTSMRSVERVREGVRVTEVIPGSPAARAGVEVGDVITDINGKGVGDVDDLEGTLRRARLGERLLVSVIRDSQRRSMYLEVGSVEGIDLKVGFRAKELEPDEVFFSDEECDNAPCLPDPESTTPDPESAGPEPQTMSPETNPAAEQYAP